MSLLYPTLYRRRITDVTAEDLHRMGVRGVLLDVDNTLTVHDAPDLTDEVRSWLSGMLAEDFSLIVVSNNKPQRVAPFADAIGLAYVARGHKPLPGAYKEAARALHLPKRECVAIGDQIFTDILGANLARIPSVLLEPIQPEVTQKFIVFKRRLERFLLKNKLQRRRKESHYAG